MKEKDADPNNKIRLDRLLFSAFLRAFANNSSLKRNDAAEYAYSVLMYMLELQSHGRKDIEPDTKCLDACLEGMIQTRDPQYISQAAKLLKLIINRYKDNSLSYLPSISTITATIKACKGCSATEIINYATEIEVLFDNMRDKPHAKRQSRSLSMNAKSRSK